MARVILGALLLFLATTIGWAQDSYKIRSGDVLRVEVLEDQTLNRDVPVLPDGSVAFPLIGELAVRGKSLAQVRQAIVAGLSPNFAAPPNVFVTIRQLATQEDVASASTFDVYVMGEVNRPGKVAVKYGTTMLQLLAESGGFTKFAATKRIQLHRASRSGQTEVYQFNYRAIEKGSATQAIRLRSGDVIVVPERRLFE
ncbi:MAG: polysaccharide export protein [Paracoccaceae bacterium]|nr:polysaccharide export protein [Paracoccaceae bacterium]